MQNSCGIHGQPDYDLQYGRYVCVPNLAAFYAFRSSSDTGKVGYTYISTVLKIVGWLAVYATGILHLDTLRVFNSRIKKLGEGEGKAKSIQSPFGVGLLVGALAVRSAYDFGCTKAELLAIKDNDEYAPHALEINIGSSSYTRDDPYRGLQG